MPSQAPLRFGISIEGHCKPNTLMPPVALIAASPAARKPAVEGDQPSVPARADQTEPPALLSAAAIDEPGAAAIEEPGPDATHRPAAPSRADHAERVPMEQIGDCGIALHSWPS